MTHFSLCGQWLWEQDLRGHGPIISTNSSIPFDESHPSIFGFCDSRSYHHISTSTNVYENGYIPSVFGILDGNGTNNSRGAGWILRVFFYYEKNSFVFFIGEPFRCLERMIMEYFTFYIMGLELLVELQYEHTTPTL